MKLLDRLESGRVNCLAKCGYILYTLFVLDTGKQVFLQKSEDPDEMPQDLYVAMHACLIVVYVCPKAIDHHQVRPQL